jgi:phosphoribosylformylglycinamidine synthase
VRVAVVLFPGSNCDHDIIHVYANVLKQDCYTVWHKQTSLKGSGSADPDLVVIPGGFSFGDYLRTGALAKVSPLMKEVARFAEKGGLVLGICNGFQVLCEAGLLAGALLQNRSMTFISKFLHLRVETSRTPFTRQLEPGQLIMCPVAHFEGNFFADKDTLKRLEGEERVVFRYASEVGEVDPDSSAFNPNGSANSIAGICSPNGRVVGMMPHPERASEPILTAGSSIAAKKIFESSLIVQ